MKQKKKVHHSRPHGTGVPHAAIQAELRRAAGRAAVRYEVDTSTQRAMWLMVVSVADAYGKGPKGMQPFFAALEANRIELQQMIDTNGQDYAEEKLRRKAEQVSGVPIRYLYEPDPQREALHD
jgi:hypothetical protein